MCFSATASILAGTVLSAGGAVTLREAKTTDRAPIAAMPLLFGVQQLVEGVVWMTNHQPRAQAAFAAVYVFFSHVLWPTYVPYAVMRLEPPGWRRTALRIFLVGGLAVSLQLAYAVFRAPVVPVLGDYGIQYLLGVEPTSYGLAAYVMLTCFSCFLSSHRYVRLFGTALLLSLGIALWSYHQSFYSVWCFFAAILSLIIYVHLRHGEILGKKMPIIKK